MMSLLLVYTHIRVTLTSPLGPLYSSPKRRVDTDVMKL